MCAIISENIVLHGVYKMQKANQYITELKKQLLYEMEHQKRNGVYGYIQRTMAYNSNKIEGSTLTELQTANIFETGTVCSDNENIIYRTKDIEEMTGHFRMLNNTLKKIDEPLSTNIIKEMHYNLKVGVFEDYINGYPCGEFKNRRNQVSTIITALPQDVPSRMQELIDEYNKIKNPSLIDLAKFHAEYETIHPFQDGNGRTGRMILFRESLKHNMIPIIIQNKNKAEYIMHLHQAQTKHILGGLASYLNREQGDLYSITIDMVLPQELTHNCQNQIDDLEL